MKFSSPSDLLILLILCNALILTQAKPKEKSTGTKNCNKNDFDTYSSNVFGQFGLDELLFPETKDELSTYCKKAKESTDFSKQYGKNCLHSTSQTLMSLAVYNFDQVNKQYCAKNGKQKDQFREWASCGNKAKPKTKVCWDKMIVTMAIIHKVKNSKSRIPIICCTYYEWIKCNKKNQESLGESVCSKAAVAGYETHINKASVDAMNLICSKYEDDPVKCGNLQKDIPDLKANKPKRLDKMPLLYVFDVFDKL